jgi:isorenieratene synthase
MRRACVVGGGIAGLAAAVVLAERGVRVILVEREGFLGGRAGSWADALGDGTPFEMERGFHAFFRQYYNLAALLRRVDPALDALVPAGDYPILAAGGRTQSFRDLPRRAPWNVAALTWRSPHLGWRDLLRVGGRTALEMLRFDSARTYARWDRVPASRYLDALRFPPEARQMLFEVFAHSFFNREEEMSAAELLMMFHFYFVGNPEGLVFDLARRPMSRAFFRPHGDYLAARGAELHLGETATRVILRGDGMVLETSRAPIEVDAVVLATSIAGVQELVGASPALAPLASSIGRLAIARPFAVHRLWLDRPLRSGRAPFVGTVGAGALDNISAYHLFQDESRAWARRTGGAVVELHAYALDPARAPEAVRAELLAGLHAFYPETAGARILDERFRIAADCSGFGPGSDASRPGVATAVRGVVLAGDYVRLGFPTALMERAAASGMLAANHLLAQHGRSGAELRSIPARGILAPRRPHQGATAA